MPGHIQQLLLPTTSFSNDGYVKILMHMEGANAGTTFTDSCGGAAAHSWSVQGSGATTSTTQAKFGSTSLSCSATGAIVTPDSTNFTLGSGDWTMDFWFWTTGAAGTQRDLCGQADSAGAIIAAGCTLTSTNFLNLTVTTTGTDYTSVTGTTSVPTSAWNHYAAVRTGNNLKLFLNGTQEGSTTAFSGTIFDSSNKFAIGQNGEFTSNYFNGFIDEFRLSVGIARWTANFTPPTVPYF